MDSARIIDYLIVGTGPTALAAAMALRRAGATFEVVDVGFDLEPEREAAVHQLAEQEPTAWPPQQLGHLFPPPKTSTKGVEKRYLFGSDFPYRVATPLEISTENCIIDVSHGFGGFGNVWGGAILPYADRDLAGWPFPVSDLAASYQEVLKYVPSSSVADELGNFFPRFSSDSRGLELSEQIQALARAVDKRKATLQKKGIWIGRSRVAVDSSGGASTCRYCGYCLDGCAYGSIFNPRLVFKRLEKEGVVIRRALYALEFREHSDGVDTVLVDLKSDQTRIIRARELLLGARSHQFHANGRKIVGPRAEADSPEG